jgi:hypothetical protein
VRTSSVVYPLDTVKTRVQASSDDSKPSSASSSAIPEPSSSSDKATPFTEQQDEDSEFGLRAGGFAYSFLGVPFLSISYEAAAGE